jgi:thiol-disulfide isomerase/thioredoxin
MMIQVLLGAVIVLAVMACANMLVTFAVIRRIAASEASGAPGDAAALALPEPGMRIGEFSTTMLTGGRYGHEDLAGRTVIAVFVSPNCAPCQEVIAALRAPLAPKGATYLIFVSGPAGDPLAEQTAAALTGSGAVGIVGSAGPVAKAFSVRGYPTLLAVEDGVVTAAGRRLEAVIGGLRPVPSL